jgi:predicted phosphodiesterase
MRYALFSDIHGNLTGLKAVLAAIPVLGGADILIAAGDHLWGESATDEILDLLAAHHVHMVRGDSDTEDKPVSGSTCATRRRAGWVTPCAPHNLAPPRCGKPMLRSRPK